MPELAHQMEDWDGRRTEDDAVFRTQRDLRAISDRLGSEYLEVIVEAVAMPVEAGVVHD